MGVSKCVVKFTVVLLWVALAVKPSAADNAFDSTSTVTVQKSTSTTVDTTVESSVESSVYDFSEKDVDGNDVCLRKYAGRVLIIVNYASACGFTYVNVNKLSELAQKYGEDGLSVLIFPSNSFFQNVGGNYAAKQFAKSHPEFEVFSEINVNGNDPLYTYLKKMQPGNCFLTSAIKWNFTKFLVNRSGCPVERFSTADSFEDIESSVQQLLYH